MSGYDVEPFPALLAAAQPPVLQGEDVLGTTGAALTWVGRRVRARYCVDFDSWALRCFIDDPDRFVDDTDALVLKADGTSTVTRTSFDGRWIVIKRYNTRNPAHAFKRALRRSRAAICWEAAARLLALGIDTPRPVVMLEKRLGPFLGRSYFVTEYVQGELCSAYFGRRASGAGAARAVDGLVETFRLLAAHGLSHGDTKATNFILQPQGRPVILDLDAFRRHRSALGRRRGFERDRKRFLRNFDDRPALQRVFAARLKALDGQPASTAASVRR